MPIKIPKTNSPASSMLTPAEAAKMLGLTERFLAKDRYESRAGGTPPRIPYVVVGYRSVRYERADIEAYIAANKVG